MNQRILLPALVIGVVFAAALTAVQILFPVADTAIQFIVNAVALLAALAVYGTMMRQATAALSDATPAAAAPRQRKQRAPRGEGARTSNSTADRSSNRNSERGERNRGRRGGRNKDQGEERGARNGGQRDRTENSETSEPAVPTGPREEGQIKWFSGTKGYGFIVRADDSEIFVHHRALRDRNRRDIPDGQSVSFVVIERDKGPQADDVEVIGNEALSDSAA